MMQLEFEIENQQLNRKDDQIIVNGTVKYVECSFEFITSEWEGVAKYAIFKNETHQNFCIPLGDECNCTCTVSGKVLKGDFFRVTVFGIINDERITTTERTVLLVRSGFTCNFESVGEESGDIFSSNGGNQRLC